MLCWCSVVDSDVDSLVYSAKTSANSVPPPSKNMKRGVLTRE